MFAKKKARLGLIVIQISDCPPNEFQRHLQSPARVRKCTCLFEFAHVELYAFSAHTQYSSFQINSTPQIAKWETLVLLFPHISILHQLRACA